MFDLEEELKKLPDSPGVYLMHDAADTVIYVGKARVLKNRVRQYFQNRSKGAKIDHMVTHIARFEYIITDSELEALILECNLIKTYRPKYNTMLTDDKTYPFIKVTVSELYPRVLFTRKTARDKARYFGPYANVYAVREIIDFLHKMYQIRSCSKALPEEKKGRPCLNYHIGRCKGCCQGEITPEAYRENIDKVIAFLSGNTAGVQKELKEKMNAASEAMEYEKAGEYLALLNEVRVISKRQKMTQSDGDDKDIIAAAMEEADCVVQIFFIRGGKMIGREHYFLHVGEMEESENKIAGVISDFLTQYYSGTPYIPNEIMLPVEIADAALIGDWLSSKKEGRVRITTPKIGMKERLMELAEENAALILKKDREKLAREEKETIGALRLLEEALGLSCLNRLEAYDISNLNGFEAVGSMVVFESGRAKKSDYRKFKIRSFQGQDDVRALKEVLTRRFTSGKKEQAQGREYSSFTRFPDLILMDGGKGQVHAAEETLEQMGIFIPVCGMVKDDHHRTRALLYQEKEYALDRDAFHLVTRIQDEAHRFAITFHRNLRSSSQVHSVLDDIPQVGPKRRKALMREFDSIDEIRKADVTRLAAIPEMSRTAAENIVAFFTKESTGE